jgi:hypothetical protein
MKIPSNTQKPLALARFGPRGLSRRRFFRTAAGTGAGVALGSKITSALADDDQGQNQGEGEGGGCQPVPRPIPHVTSPPGTHFFFPGPVDADYVASPITGHDPSLITDFKGIIGNADLNFSGTGTDLNTGNSAIYNFHADMRFMSGTFVGLDNQEHKGAFGFI